MPEQVSSYRLEGVIGTGGMGIVYKALHTVFEEVVAIKAIFPELTLNPQLRARFVNEAKIQRRLEHPNIVQVREFLIDQGRYYIVMEFVEGETLAQRLSRLIHVGGSMSPKEALGIFGQALQGLGFAHARGVIHRDMKPSNIMLTPGGSAKLTDFGLARAVSLPGLTRAGAALGTPAYMAPEQIQGRKVDQRADIYSMGVTLYEMVAGRLPFERPRDSDNDFAVLTAQVNEPPPAPSDFAPIPGFLEIAILKALAKKPEDRYQSCEQFQAAIAPPGPVERKVYKPTWSKPVVLLADDDEYICELVTEVLSQDGYRVVSVTSGTAAVERAPSLAPDLALLGVRMPGMGGVEAALEILRFSPDTKIILLTEQASEAELRRLKANGFDVPNVIAPFKISYLRAVVAGTVWH